MKKKSKSIDPNQPASLFVGRFQPFHDGHKKLMESVLKNGKPIVVAIRDTEISKKNPLSVTERWTLIQQGLQEYGELVKIIRIPDIDEVCYGREVGYLIRRIHLDEQIEQISATNIRAKGKQDFPIIWLTGQSGSGKSTLGRALEKQINGVLLDGDEMRQSISLNAGFTKEDREEHNLRVARLAKVLAKQKPVVVAVIAPFQETRDKITTLIDPIWIYIKKKVPKEANKPYMVPRSPNFIIDTDKSTTTQNIKKLINFVNSKVIIHE